MTTENNTIQDTEGGSPLRFIHLGIIFRKIIVVIQFLLALAVIGIGVMLWLGSLDFKFIANFFALISLLTGCIVFTSCTSYEIKYMKRFLTLTGIAGLIAGIAGAFVFWKILPSGSWYFINLILISGICFSLFAETEKGRKTRSVMHVVSSIIILFTTALTIFHTGGIADLQLPLLILYGATFILVCIVVYRNYKSHNL